MRIVIAIALLAVVVVAPSSAQTAMLTCYYRADDTAHTDAAEVASNLAFPFSIGALRTDEARAASAAFMRTIGVATREFAQIYPFEQTDQGRRYGRANGFVAALSMSSCDEGAERIRAYLSALKPLAQNQDAAAELDIFILNLRQVTREELESVSPPTSTPPVRRD